MQKVALISCGSYQSLKKFWKNTWYDLGHCGPIQIYLNCMFPVGYHLSERGNTEIMCFIFANPQNKMISDMSVLFR